MDSIPSADLRQAKRCYEIEVRAPAALAGAELVVVENQDAVRLEAQLIQTTSLPATLREVSRTGVWRTEEGDLRAETGSHGATKAIWYPPLESKTVTVEFDGWITLEIVSERGSGLRETIHLQERIEFLIPASSIVLVGGTIDGYQLGDYPDPADPELDQKYRLESHWHELHPDRYQIPSFFYKVNRRSKNLLISEHLRLGDFAIDFAWGTLGMPQYIALDMRLVEKLEELIEMMQADGYAVSGLTPIYGFRPPAFNLGTIEAFPDTNLKVPFSMHQFGRAYDFIIDEDGDLVMDDLNGDGVSDMHDAAVVMHYVNELDRTYRAEGNWAKVGGAGLYERHDFVGRVQTPYIHVDTRGFQRENETLIRWPAKWPDGSFIRWGEV